MVWAKKPPSPTLWTIGLIFPITDETIEKKFQMYMRGVEGAGLD